MLPHFRFCYFGSCHHNRSRFSHFFRAKEMRGSFRVEAGGRRPETGDRADKENFIYTRRDNVLMMACFFAYKVCKRKEAENIYEIAAELASECRKKLEN